MAEDNYLVREGTAALLAEVDGIEVCASVEDFDSLMQAVDEHRPDVVLTDIRMPPGQSVEGIDAAKKIRQLYPGTGVLLLSQYLEEEYAFSLLNDGAEGLGYLLKERVSDLDQLARSLKDVAGGGTVLDPEVVQGLINRREKMTTSPLKFLTEREIAVLDQMARGKTNAGIASSLHLSKRAVEKHIHSLFQKLNLPEEPEVHRRVSAVLLFLRSGDVSVSEE